MVKFFISALRIKGTLHAHMVSTSRLNVGLRFSITCLIVLFDSNLKHNLKNKHQATFSKT